MAIVRTFNSIPANLAEWDRFFRQATLDDGDITDEKLRNSVPTSVIGRADNTVGSPADIQAVDNDLFLARRSDALGFFALVPGDIPEEIARVLTVSSITTDATAAADSVYLVDTTAGVVTVTLPSPTDGDQIHIKKIAGGNAVDISGDIDGQTSISIYLQYQSVNLIGTSTSWYIV